MKTLLILLGMAATAMAVTFQGIGTISGVGTTTGSFKSQIIVATRGNFPSAFGGQLSDGIETAATSRMKMLITADCSAVRLLFANYNSEAGDSTAVDPINVSAAWDDGTNISQITFSGASSITIQPGASILSDAIAGSWTKGQSIWWRSYVSVAAGLKWPKTLYYNWHGGTNENSLAGNQLAVPASSFGSGGGIWFGPLFAVGTVASSTPCVALVGDSIQVSAFNGLEFNGLVRDSLGPNWGQNTPSLLVAKGGETARVFSTASNATLRNDLILRYTTCAVSNYGINDVISSSDSIATIKASLVILWTRLASYGCEVWQTTLLPQRNSTNTNWLSNATREGIRTSLNDWIRTTPVPLRGYFDTSAAIETAGIWNPGAGNMTNTDEGLHPNTTGQTVITNSGAINPTLLK